MIIQLDITLDTFNNQPTINRIVNIMIKQILSSVDCTVIKLPSEKCVKTPKIGNKQDQNAKCNEVAYSN